MEPEISIAYSQLPATLPYPVPTLLTPHDPLQLPEDASYYYPPIYVWVTPISYIIYSYQFKINLISTLIAGPR
jgi:hypothetical protein